MTDEHTPRPTPETDALHAKQGLTHAQYRDFVKRLERERDEACEELADIRQRLKGHPDSKLDGENGLAAATMRGFDGFQVENEAMRTAIKGAYEALDNCVEFINDAHIIEAQWQWEPVKQARAALTKLQSFLKP